ncbi:polycomb protein suz12-A-like [Oppia nitens]|uniref:polycomb protein suz12-A-like n=1 Tax=Oppia nitens TaxID=1686743 RepID=UPI0023DCCFB7|nr:polycomb protein suz12-A-like [Oppia nitens]
MSSKKRVRSHDNNTSDWSNRSSVDKECKSGDKYNETNNLVENELFLQAFEKPTQIYRYLRTRHLVSPIFLNRNLTYLRHRLKRFKSKRRRDFSVDNIMEYVLEKKQREAIAEESSGNLTLKLLCIKDQSINNEYSSVTLETSLLKMGHQKRKDVLAPIYQYSVGASDTTLNGENFDNNCLTVYKNDFNESNGQIVKQWSYSLLFIACLHKDNHSKLDNLEKDKPENIMNENNRSEPSMKKRRLDTKDYYKAELIVFDKHKTCLLTDGEYTVVLQQCLPPKANKLAKYGKYSKWQEISVEDIKSLTIEDNKPYGSMDVFRKGPVLKFQLSWSSNQQNINTNTNNNNSNSNHLVSNNENDSGIGNNMSDNSSNQSYNSNHSPNLDKTHINDHLNCNINGLSNRKNSNVVQIKYQFIFNNNIRQITRPRIDMCCPWCSLNCQQLYSLIKHLKLCHCRFLFNYIPDVKCSRIDVFINEGYDGSYAGNPLDLSFPNTGFAFSRNGPVRRSPVTQMIVCRPKRHPHCMNEFDEPDDEDAINCRTYITGHNRLYYHTNSCLPIRPQGMDYDSEGENDPQWMKQKTQMMIDEFTDVNEGEKEVMKMWNLHIMKYGFVGDCQIPLACNMFVDEKATELVERNLYMNFILHLNNLYDFGLLSQTNLWDSVRKLHQLIKNSESIEWYESDTNTVDRQLLYGLIDNLLPREGKRLGTEEVVTK